MHYPELESIIGFDTSGNRHSAIVHYIRHFAVDLSGVPTPDAYLALAQDLGRSAARSELGTHVKVRGNGNLAVYVDTPKSRAHSYFKGIYMAVRIYGTHGLLITMFAPRDGLDYFDGDDRLLM